MDFAQSQAVGVVNVFCCKGQLQVVITDHEGKRHRCAIPLVPGALRGSISGAVIDLDWSEAEIMRMRIGKKYDLTLRAQPKGHFFSPLENRLDDAERISPADAFKALQAARGAKK